MRLLLTSGGFRNQGIKDALGDLLDKPYAQSRVIFIPTAANPEGGHKDWLLKDLHAVFAMGWQNFDIMDIAAFASLPKELWWSRFEQADALVFGGGTSFYLSYWLQQTGLMSALPGMLKTKVYVGISAGSMVACDSLRVSTEALQKFGQLKDDEYDELGPAGQSSSQTLGLTDFVVRPHLNSSEFPKIRDDFLRQVAKTLTVPMYAIDDQTALKVIDGAVEVISNGDWKLYNSKQ